MLVNTVVLKDIAMETLMFLPPHRTNAPKVPAEYSKYSIQVNPAVCCQVTWINSECSFLWPVSSLTFLLRRC